MTILITGFDPFGEVSANPSQAIIEALDGSPGLVTHTLPVIYAQAGARLNALIDATQPQAVIALGVARGRPAISLERIALNLDDASAPDNAGELRQGVPIAADGPLAYESTLPLHDLLAALKARGIPAHISNHAGAYLCNHVFYSARHHLTRAGRPIPCGFIHVPAVGDPADGNGLPLAMMIDAAYVCLTLVRNHLAK